MTETAAQNNNSELWLPDGAIKAEERDSSDQLKIAIVGPQKGGKSRLAATSLRKPIYFWDYDCRLISVSGMEGVYGKSYPESTNMIESTAWPAVMQDMNMFEYQKAKGSPMPGTMVHDSIMNMFARAMQWILVNNPDMRREIIMNKATNTKSYVPYKYDPYKAEFDQVCNILNRTLELGCDLVCCFHERAEEAPNSTDANPIYTGKFSVHPPRAAGLLPSFNELWRMRPNDQGVYKVQTKPNYEFVGATCLNINEEEEPNITQMIQKHKSNKGQK